MKKNLFARLQAPVLVTGLALTFALTGCSSTTTESAESAASAEESTAEEAEETASKEYPAEAYVVNIPVNDYMELADYKNIEFTAEKEEVTQEAIQAQIDMFLLSSATLEEVTDRDTVQEGDTVNIDYKGTRDGVAFDGGTAEGFDLEIGSGRFIKGFEEGLIGVKKGETVDLNLRFPEDYMNTDLAGAEVVFTVTVNKIQASVEPQLTDEFVKGLAQTDDDGNPIETVAQFEDYIRHYLEEESDSAYRSAIQEEAMTYLIENSTFKEELPPEMNTRLHDMITDVYSYYAAMYGVDLETFMNTYVGSETGDYEKDLQDMTDRYQKQLMIIRSIAEAEGLTLTEQETEERIAELAESSGVTLEEYKENMDLRALEEDLVGEKVMEYLTENAKKVLAD